MIPCLYDKSETAFDNNGIGKLSDTISCVVTEKRNSSYELEMEYPSDGLHADSIQEGMIILARPAPDVESQPFRIYKITTPLSGILKIYGEHISYQLNYITISPFDETGCAETLADIENEDTGFTFTTDIKSDGDFSLSEPLSIRNCLGGIDGSVLDTFGGEYEWNRFNVILHKKRGEDNGVRIVYGKNLIDFTMEKNIEEVITGIHPYYKNPEDGTIIELTERVIQNESDFPKIVVLDCTEHFDEEPTEDELREYAQNYLESTTLTEPSIDIDIDFLELSKVPGYEDVAEAESVNLCDTVYVYITKLNIEVSCKVTETEFDVLLDRYKSITLSNSDSSSRNSSLSSTLSGISNAASTALTVANGAVTYKYLNVNYVNAEELEATYATLEYIKANYTTTEYLSANYATIAILTSNYATLNALDTVKANISDLSATVATINEAYITKADVDTILTEKAFITTAEIQTLLANYASINYLDTHYLSADDINSTYATLEFINTNYLTAETIESDYIKADLTNFTVAMVGTLLADSGIITSMSTEYGYVTGMLSSVEINADLITAGTLSVERLLLTGEDGLIYEINVSSSGLSETQLTDEIYQNYINGTVIVAKSITADQIASGTITANEIAANTITASNIAAGTITALQVDMSSLTADQAFINAITTNSVVVSAYETAQKSVASVIVYYALSTSSTEAPTEGWSTTSPERQDGYYIWTKTVTTYNNGDIDESDITCISGADGADAITLVIESSAGSVFKNTSIVTTLTARVYQSGSELTSTQIAALGTIYWYKDGSSTSVGTGTSLVISESEDISSATYVAQLES